MAFQWAVRHGLRHATLGQPQMRRHSVSGVVDKVVACYDRMAADEELHLSKQTKPPIPGPLSKL